MRTRGTRMIRHKNDIMLDGVQSSDTSSVKAGLFWGNRMITPIKLERPFNRLPFHQIPPNVSCFKKQKDYVGPLIQLRII